MWSVFIWLVNYYSEVGHFSTSLFFALLTPSSKCTCHYFFSHLRSVLPTGFFVLNVPPDAMQVDEMQNHLQSAYSQMFISLKWISRRGGHQKH